MRVATTSVRPRLAIGIGISAMVVLAKSSCIQIYFSILFSVEAILIRRVNKKIPVNLIRSD